MPVWRSSSLLPYRQLRKYATVRTFGINGLLPYRQLRNATVDNIMQIPGLLPYRQLRNNQHRVGLAH